MIYHLLNDGLTYQELGAGYFDQRDREHIARQSVRRLRSLGYQVTLERGAA